jgi:PAS domain-containing protein
MHHYMIDIILKSISDGVFTVGHEWRMTSFNRAAEEITGIHQYEAPGEANRKRAR